MGTKLAVVPSRTVFVQYAVCFDFKVEQEFYQVQLECSYCYRLCTGIIEQFLYGVIRGNGIFVVPNVIGNVLEVLESWRLGKLRIPKSWPEL